MSEPTIYPSKFGLIWYAFSLLILGLAFYIPSPLNVPFAVMGTMMIVPFLEAHKDMMKVYREGLRVH